MPQREIGEKGRDLEDFISPTHSQEATEMPQRTFPPNPDVVLCIRTDGDITSKNK